MGQYRKYTLLLVISLLGAIMIGSALNITYGTASSTITMWYMEDGSQDDTLLALVDEFETQKGITINMVQQPRDSLRGDFKIADLLDNAPDLIQGDSEWIADLVHSDMLEPLTADDFKESYMDSAKRAVAFFYRADGEYALTSPPTLTYYGFPYSADTLAFVYDKDNATKATGIPGISGTWTMTQFKTQITKLNDQSIPSNKQFGFTFINIDETINGLFSGASGVMFSDYTIDLIHNKMNSTISRTALNYVYDMIYTYELTPNYESGYYIVSNALRMDRIKNDFQIIGNVSSTMLLGSQMKWLTSTGIYTNQTKLGIAPCPVDSTGSYPFLDVNALMLYKRSANKDLAKELAQFLTSKASMVQNAKNESILPTILSAYDDPELTTKSILQSYKTLIQRASPKYLSRFWINVKSIFKDESTKLLRKTYTEGYTCAQAIEIFWNMEILNNADLPGIGADVSGYRWYPYEETETEKKISGANVPLLITSLIAGIYILNRIVKRNGEDR